ncbi:GFA family protein [Mesorhizobium sp. SP-1A]|uniref:GFA family protein n=1 Tax=Mesorhizobium sp. SP-1A TaxID=3077840 RepID=UPI0028F6E2D2|nr:GFA family protein [Mesorhizobium sp. SP-1A]
MHTGHCLCGGVRYEVRGDLTGATACHCSQCARASGNFAATAACRAQDLVISGTDKLTWFRSSENAQRGFCSRCGGNLFWKADSGEEVYVTLGTLNRPTGLRLQGHIFVGSKADFYDLTDGLPQKEEY